MRHAAATNMAQLRRISIAPRRLPAAWTKRQPVQSSVLRAVRYHPSRHILEVQFLSGRVYRYFDLPHDVYEKLLAAPSIGAYFNKMIRPRYRMEPVR
jgi:KTSC domain